MPLSLRRLNQLFADMKVSPRYCVVMPTFENAGTVCSVVDSVIAAGYRLIAVCDGPRDGTEALLEGYGDRITLVAYRVNRGKGHALSVGFAKALEEGYDYAVTIDSDGQHNVPDIASLIEASRRHPSAVSVGKRMMDGVERPASSGFANRFANFWFAVHTLRVLPDTQSGMRCYPLDRFAKSVVRHSRFFGGADHDITFSGVLFSLCGYYQYLGYIGLVLFVFLFALYSACLSFVFSGGMDFRYSVARGVGSDWLAAFGFAMVFIVAFINAWPFLSFLAGSHGCLLMFVDGCFVFKVTP